MDVESLSYIRVDFRDDYFEEHTVNLRADVYVNLCEAALMVFMAGENALRYRNIMHSLLHAPILINYTDKPDKAFYKDIAAAEGLFTFFLNRASEYEWASRTEVILALSHMLLYTRQATRETVYEMATILLPEAPPKSANSWRVRVDGYAAKRGLRPVGQPLRKPRAR